jgi:ABC-type transport system involved in cytochrome c biogenesis ATPase subunit
VVLVHGPGGIGKSALLRQVADRGRAAGWTPVLVEGRDLPPVPDAIEDALADAHQFERPLILIDTYERMGTG